jgi:uncharacterized protein involved in exopolysaccharide biosynthesis
LVKEPEHDAPASPITTAMELRHKMPGRASLIGAVLLMIVGAAFLLVGGSEQFLSRWLPPEYETKVVIRIEPGQMGDPSTNSPPYDPYFIPTEFEMIQSEIILNRVVTNLDLKNLWADKSHPDGKLTTSDCRRRIKAGLSFHAHPATNRVDIRMRGTDKTQIALIANGIADSYVDYNERQWRERLSALTKAHQAQLSAMEAKLQAARERAKQLKTELGVVEPAAGRTETNTTAVERCRESAIENQAQLLKAEKMLVRVRALDRLELRNTLASISQDAQLASLLHQLDGMELKQNGLTPTSTDSSDTLGTKAVINDLNQKINDRMDGIVAGMEVQLEGLKTVARDLETRVEEAKKAEFKTADTVRPYYQAKQDATDLESAQDGLKAKLDALAAAEKPKTAEIISRAQIPAEAIPNGEWIRALLLGFGVILELAGLVLLIRWSQAKLHSVA